VLLALPQGVVVPAFFQRETDAAVLTQALALGALGVEQWQGSAQEAKLQTLLTQRTQALECEVARLQVEREAHAVTVAAATEVRLRLQLQQEAAPTQLALQRAVHEAEGRAQQAEEDRQRTQRAAQHAQEMHAGELRQLQATCERVLADARECQQSAQAMRAAERSRYESELAALQQGYAQQVALLQASIEQFKQEAGKQRETAEWALAVRERELEAAQADARAAAAQAAVQRNNSCIKGTAGERSLQAVLCRAFSLAEGYELEVTAKQAGSGTCACACLA
jgi:hypothetical protein